jgi:hypothetical protein
MKLNTKIVLASVLLLLIAAPAARAGDEWKFGVGTGFFALNLDGDVGLDTVGGPLEISIDLDNSDVADLVESAFGLSGFAAKDKWRILYAFQTLTLEGDGSNATRRANLTFDATGASVFGEYNFANAGDNSFGALFGLQFTKHELEGNYFDTTVMPAVLLFNRNVDNDWVDGVVGLTHALSITDRVSWANRVHAAFGGSDGTYLLNTGINWHFAKHWSASFFGQYNAVDYENDDPGDPDWYLYDVDEFGVGIGVTYLF